MPNKPIARWREYFSEKLNPAQASIHSMDPISTGTNIAEFEKAYQQIEIIHRAVEMVINACVEIPLIVEGTGPVKKVDKILNKRPNPFEDRCRLFRRAFLDFQIDGNAFFYYDGNDLFVLPANDVTVVSDAKTFNFTSSLKKRSSFFDTLMISIKVGKFFIFDTRLNNAS